MSALVETSASGEQRLQESTLAIEAAGLLALFRKSAGEPPRLLMSPKLRLCFERVVEDREELVVSRVNLPGHTNRHPNEEHISVIAGVGHGWVQYSRVVLDGSAFPEVYTCSSEAVAKTRGFLCGLQLPKSAENTP